MDKQQYSLITKKHGKNIWRKYIKAIEEYKLISDGDKIHISEELSAAGKLMKMLISMTAEFGMYDIEIVEKDKCNKIACPDYFQEIMDNTLWEMMYNGRIYSLLPKEKQDGITIIRPLYFIHKEHMDEWVCEAGIVTQEIKESEKTIQLTYIRRMVEKLSENNEAVENNVFGSITNVDADMLPGYNLGEEHHKFLEWY